MKLSIFAVLFCLTLVGQERYERLVIYGTGYQTNVTLTSISLGTNEVCEVASYRYAGFWYANGGYRPPAGLPELAVVYAEGLNHGKFNLVTGDVVLGPAVIVLSGFPDGRDNNGFAMTILHIHQVNVTSATAAVLPAGAVGHVEFETSMDLKTWKPTRAGDFYAGSSNRFFRVEVSLGLVPHGIPE